MRNKEWADLFFKSIIKKTSKFDCNNNPSLDASINSIKTPFDQPSFNFLFKSRVFFVKSTIFQKIEIRCYKLISLLYKLLNLLISVDIFFFQHFNVDVFR